MSKSAVSSINSDKNKLNSKKKIGFLSQKPVFFFTIQLIFLVHINCTRLVIID